MPKLPAAPKQLVAAYSRWKPAFLCAYTRIYLKSTEFWMGFGGVCVSETNEGEGQLHAPHSDPQFVTERKHLDSPGLKAKIVEPSLRGRTGVCVWSSPRQQAVCPRLCVRGLPGVCRSPFVWLGLNGARLPGMIQIARLRIVPAGVTGRSSR